MKNIFKLSQVVILVLLFGVIAIQVAAQQLPARQSSNQGGIKATEIAAPGTPSTTIYTPPVTDDPAAVLYNNGPIVNSVGTGAGGADESFVVNPPLNVFGFTAAYMANFSVADDFVVPAGTTWAVSSMEFFTYQTGSGLTSTINGLAMQIWNGKPGIAGSAVIWGDFVTDRLTSTTFSNIYRVSTPLATSRPIMQVVANTPGLLLPAGTYWVEWAFVGTLASGPWAPPLVAATPATGNAIQSADGGVTYSDCLSPSTALPPPYYPQGLPFIINGTVAAPIPTLGEWGLILLGLTLLGFGTFYILRMGRA